MTNIDPSPGSVAIVGASADRSKYGNKAVRAYRAAGWNVHPVHPDLDEVEGLRCYRSVAEVPRPVDRVSLYVPPEVGIDLLAAIADAAPGELFVNPGAESDGLVARARELGLDPILACSIVDVGGDPRVL